MSNPIAVAVSFESEWMTMADAVSVIAKAARADVELLHVADGLEVHHTEWAHRLKQEYAERGVTAAFTWLSGEPVSVVKSHVHDTEPLLVGVGASDPASVKGGWHAGRTIRLVREVSSPVLVVPVTSRRPSTTAPWRVLLATDLSTRCASGLQFAVGLLQHAARQLDLVHVVPLPREGGAWPDTTEGLPEAGVPFTHHVTDAERALDRLVLDTLVPVARRVVRDADVAQRVVQEAQETDADVIVVASHGHSGLGTLLLGSVAESVLQVADRPVLVVPVGR